MPTSAPFTLTLIAVAALAGSAYAQSADTSGAMSAEMQSQTAASPGKATRPLAKRPPSASMNTGASGPAAAPTGPYTSTDSAGETSDLSGSTGASIPQPAAPAPPGVAPPGGAPDTGGGEAAPNVEGGPHARGG
ncbi:hypothetical protein [Caulobacter sp. S45]|uniref:hypothetical protein n=1 Tax=Caulobacter sp. S45 TaxID=1641861 RepID=UPI001576F19E|nr:hypothetical protein [Caulobacter sp. S45]